MTIENTAYAPELTEQPAVARKDTLLARAAGYDVAAAATDTGLVISAQAIDPGHSYDTHLSYLTADGQSSELASRRVDAESAPRALALLIDNEKRSGGLDLVDVAALEKQLTQIDAALHASQPETTHVVEDVDVARTQRGTVVGEDPPQGQAMPPVPTVAGIYGTPPAVTTKTRERAELSMLRQPHAFGQQVPGR